ncbi:MAG: UDP-N-acetylglucosamine 1-carboxyvinyltransferase, partial [Eubacterium sp.]|nr:UDP-N-acetylglucosamine 1-carboxyvinyltransferase [Eubacterium sp.]
SGCKIYLSNNRLKISAPKRLKHIRKTVTAPYPGFPTDCQALICSALCTAKGRSVITETVFENRFGYVNELRKLGADIYVKNSRAVIKGVERLFGAELTCTDLRGGAAAVIASLNAEGESRIYGITHIDRGYEKLEEILSSLGADIKRINYEKEQ